MFGEDETGTKELGYECLMISGPDHGSSRKQMALDNLGDSAVLPLFPVGQKE